MNFVKTRLEKFEFPQEFIKCNTIPKNLIGKKIKRKGKTNLCRKISVSLFQLKINNLR